MFIREDQTPEQMTLDLDPGLTDRYRSVKEVIAAGVYRRGLKRTAADLDVAPGNLSVQLSGDGQRHLDVDLLERYIHVTGDLTPIHYLVSKYCGDKTADKDEAVERLRQMLSELPRLLDSVGASKKAKAR